MSNHDPNDVLAMNENEKHLTEKFLRKLALRYPEISLDWLLTGEGEMLNPRHNVTKQSIVGNNNHQQSGSNNTVVNGRYGVGGGNVSGSGYHKTHYGFGKEEVMEIMNLLSERHDRMTDERFEQLQQKDAQIQMLIEENKRLSNENSKLSEKLITLLEKS